MKRLAATGVGLLLALCAACSNPDTPAPAPSGSATAAAGDFAPQLPMAELMAHVIDHAADGIWLNQGWVINAEGTTELFPTDEAGWRNVENAALTLAESANLLLLPGRPLDEDPAWRELSIALNQMAMKAHDAAVARDKQAFFDAGGDIYVVCRDCHQRYIIGDTN